MSEFGPKDFEPKEFNPSQWVSGEVGVGLSPEDKNNSEYEHPRPDKEEIEMYIDAIHDIKESGNDQYYELMRNKWKLYAEGKGPSVGFEGWNQEDFKSVFDQLLDPDKNL